MREEPARPDCIVPTDYGAFAAVFVGKQLHLAAEAWSQQDESSQAEAMMQGGRPGHGIRITEVAEGKDDVEFMAQVEWLFTRGELWQAMPPRSHTVAFRAHTFAPCSRIGCAFYKLLQSKHRNFPLHDFQNAGR